MILIVDYGMGNLKSVYNALSYLNVKNVSVSGDYRDILKADKIIFPGVGAFGKAYEELNNRELLLPLKDVISGGKPFLGICLGLQLLFNESEEAPESKGLGIFPGTIKKFSLSEFKVPHMGWNNVRVMKENPIFKDLPNDFYAYFVHSYFAPVSSETRAVTEYEVEFSSALSSGNIYALQFHPEKSQKAGLKILKNFVNL